MIELILLLLKIFAIYIAVVLGFMAIVAIATGFLTFIEQLCNVSKYIITYFREITKALFVEFPKIIIKELLQKLHSILQSIPRLVK